MNRDFVETKVIKEGGRPRFVIMDYRYFKRFQDLLEDIEGAVDLELEPPEGPSMCPWRSFTAKRTEVLRSPPGANSEVLHKKSWPKNWE